jgi:osmotically-inducible protein OsmY
MTSIDIHAAGFVPQGYTRDVTADVERRIAESFRRCGDIDWREIHVDVDGERVTLTGTVSTSLQRWAAEYAALDSPGIARVDNRLVVWPTEKELNKAS